MAVFTKNDKNRLDWKLLRQGSVTKFFQEQQLIDAVEWLREQDYILVDVDCSRHTAISELLKRIGDGLEFPSYFRGNSLDAFDDHLYSIQIPTSSGIAIVFHRYDLIVKSEPHRGWQILNILDRHSRLNLLYGLRFMTLIQSANPRLELEAVGAQAVDWNSKEWLDSQRGL